MAGNTVQIGRANIALTGNSASLITATRKAGQSLSQHERRVRALRRQYRRVSRSARNFGRSIGSLQGAIALVAGSGGIGLLLRQQARYGAQLEEASQRTGFAVEQLQLLSRAFRGDGASAEAAQKSLERFLRSSDEAAQGVAEYAEPFERLNINVAEHVRLGGTQEELLYRVADGLAATENQASRAAIAYDIFGRQGLTLLTTLQRGSGSLQESIADFRRLGLVTSRDAITLKALEQSYEDLGDTIRTGLAQGVAGSAEDLRRLNEELIRLVPLITQQIIPALVALIRNLDLVAVAFGALGGFGRGGAIGAAIGFGLTTAGVAIARARTEAAALAQQIEELNQQTENYLATLEAQERARLSTVPASIGPRGRASPVSQQSSELLEALEAERRRRAAVREITRNTTPDLSPGPRPSGGASDADLARAVQHSEILVQHAQERLRLRRAGTEAARADLESLQEQAASAAAAVRSQEALVGLASDNPATAAIAAELAARENLAATIRRINRDIASGDSARAIAARKELATLRQQTQERMRAVQQIAEAARRTQELENAQASLAAQQARVQELAASVGGAFERSLESVILFGESASDAVRQLAAELVAALARALIIQPIVSAILGGLGLPAYASGGYAPRGLALVGERGPELVDFRRPARVYSNEDLRGAFGGGGGGTSVTVVNNVEAGVNAEQVEEVLARRTPELVEAARRVVARDLSRPSPMSRQTGPR